MEGLDPTPPRVVQYRAVFSSAYPTSYSIPLTACYSNRMNTIVLAVAVTVVSMVVLLVTAVAAYAAFKLFREVAKASETLQASGLAHRNATLDIASAFLGMADKLAALDETVKTLAGAVNGFPADMQEAKEALLCLPEFAKGLTQFTKDEVDALRSMTTSIDKFRAIAFSGGGDGVMEYDETKAAFDDEVFAVMESANCDQEEAEARVKQNRLYRNMKITRG